MLLDDVFESDLSMKRTVWSKRGDKITKRIINEPDPLDIRSRDKIKVLDDENED